MRGASLQQRRCRVRAARPAMRRALPRCVNFATLQEFSATTLMIDIFFALLCCRLQIKGGVL